MTYCPTHPDRPLVIEHTSRKPFCIACFTERMKRLRKGLTPSEKAIERLRDYRARKREGRPTRRAEKQVVK